MEEGRKKRKIDICNSDSGIESMQMTYIPTPKYENVEDKDDSVKKKEILKEFPDTDDEKRARYYISKIICAKLTLCMRKGLLKEGQVRDCFFYDIVDLFGLFITTHPSPHIDFKSLLYFIIKKKMPQN